MENGIHKIKYFEEIDENTEKDVNVLTAKKSQDKGNKNMEFQMTELMNFKAKKAPPGPKAIQDQQQPSSGHRDVPDLMDANPGTLKGPLWTKACTQYQQASDAMLQLEKQAVKHLEKVGTNKGDPVYATLPLGRNLVLVSYLWD